MPVLSFMMSDQFVRDKRGDSEIQTWSLGSFKLVPLCRTGIGNCNKHDEKILPVGVVEVVEDVVVGLEVSSEIPQYSRINTHRHCDSYIKYNTKQHFLAKI